MAVDNMDVYNVETRRLRCEDGVPACRVSFLE